ncbi:DUF5134 domain-containing protein [Nocardia sp. NPDC052254]|uniref:DUF5134 domain-containing protein n=1 Tax=Nocardia sp. NPDC052254 TaxID=3155681 RepID=UPI0034190E8E
MGSFMIQHEALRWGVAAAFVVAAAIVAVRHISVPVASGSSGALRAGMWSAGEADHEADAAHLMMCLVMLAMLLFPATAAPDAIRGVLIAMIVVYAILLVVRIGRWRKTFTAADFRTPTLGYHLVAAAAMLWVMSGHRHGASDMARAPAVPVAIAAALFALDALLLIIPRTRHLLRHNISHLPGAPGALGAVPHVVMDLGTAYMLVASVAG